MKHRPAYRLSCIRQWRFDNLVTLTFDLLTSGSVHDHCLDAPCAYMCTKFCMDSSSGFPFRVWTRRTTQRHAKSRMPLILLIASLPTVWISSSLRPTIPTALAIRCRLQRTQPSVKIYATQPHAAAAVLQWSFNQWVRRRRSPLTWPAHQPCTLRPAAMSYIMLIL